MKRRRYLELVGVAVGASLSGCNWFSGARTPRTSGRPTPAAESGGADTTNRSSTPTPTPGERFGTVLDAVADVGCDPSGENPCDGAVRDAIADDTLIEFPPGEYLVTEPLLVERDIRFGIRGLGDDRREVRFVHPSGYSDLLLNVRDGRGCLFENFTADQTADRATNSGFVFLQHDGLRVRDVEVAGFSPTEGGSIDMIVQILDESGVGVVERYVRRGGAEVGVYPDAWQGFYAGRKHHGTLRLVDCHVEEAGSNGVYATRTDGQVQVIGGVFKNNAVSQVRVSGEGSFVRNARIVIDTESADRVAGTYNAVRGIWWESGEFGKTGGAVENCEFVVESAELERGLVEVDGTGGSMAVRDCEFRIDRDGFWALVASPPGVSSMGGAPDRPWNVTLEGVRIAGSASDNVAVQIDGRPDTTVDGLTVDQTSGTDRDGILLANCPGAELLDATCRTSRYPLWVYTDESVGNANCLLRLEGTVLTSTAVDRRQLAPVFDTDGSGTSEGSSGESEVCVPLPSGGRYSVVSTREEGGRYLGIRPTTQPPYLVHDRK